LKQQLRSHVEVFKKIRGFLAEDYYLLAPQPREFGHWEGWQFHNPATDAGFVQAFRTKEAPQPAKALAVMGLKPNLNYRFTDPYTGEAFDLSGARAMSAGVQFRLLPDSSKVLMYQALK
jgi:hypothetical protein